jgi:hypothetical protein
MKIVLDAFVFVAIVGGRVEKHFHRKPLRGNYMRMTKQGKHGGRGTTRIIDFTRNRRGRDAAKCSRGTICIEVFPDSSRCTTPAANYTMKTNCVTGRHTVSREEGLFIIRQKTTSQHQAHRQTNPSRQRFIAPTVSHESRTADQMRDGCHRPSVARPTCSSPATLH